MKLRHLITQNISYYKPFYRLIFIAITIAIAVITGSFVVGDSVRSTLVKRVDERLGKAETIVFSRYSYLDDEILDNLKLRVDDKLHTASLSGVLLINGFVSVSGNLIPVMVWGTNDLGIEKGEAKINSALADEMNAVETRHATSLRKNIVLRLPAAGMVPLGSMYVTDTYTTSLRLELTSVLSVEEGGNLNLKNEQTIPFNIFVNREELAEAMGVSGKINLILSDKKISRDEFASVWNYVHSGLNIETENELTTITSDRIFIQDKVVETVCNEDSSSNRIYSYLANSFRRNEQTIPYSFVTAVDFYKGEKLNPNEIILSDYAAKRLNVRLNDTVSISYFISKQLKTLLTDSIFLKVGKIVPLTDLQSDKTLAAEFPGLSNVERCTDWNSDLPINMNLITDEDEHYWELYKNTPKALLPYSTMASRWKNAFGSATALQIENRDCLSELTHEMFDIQLIYPRETGLLAAKSGVDFSSLFLSLGIFIIISAAILMLVPLSEMLFRRRSELNLLRATGFSNKRIFRLLWRESIPVVLFSALLGIIVGLIYTYLILFLLGSVWKGATHTDGFRVYPDLITIVVSLISGIVLALSLLYIGIKRALITRIATDKKPKRICANLFNLRHPCAFTVSRLIWASIRHSKKQALLSFTTLTLGVFILFSVGLNRQGFADSSKIRTATGGFSLWCETSVPVYHNIQTDEGRAKLGITDLRTVRALRATSLQLRTTSIQLLKYTADDASCLNLNKVVTPNVLGVDMNELENSDFKITKTIYDDSFVFEKLKTAENSVYPALVDETVLQWSLGKKLGDTLVYVGEKGKTVSILLAGTIQNSIFQGYILIDKMLFTEIWSEISGSEIMLLKVPEEEVEYTKAIITQALNKYGVRVMTTGERLRMFYSVIDTYLTIFLTLGGIGLLLGIFSFIIVVRKNLVARKAEINLYHSLGFGKQRIIDLLYRENIIVPLCAIFVGASGSLIGVSMGFGNVSSWVLGIAGLFLAGFIGSVVGFVRISVSCWQCLPSHEPVRQRCFSASPMRLKWSVGKPEAS